MSSPNTYLKILFLSARPRSPLRLPPRRLKRLVSSLMLLTLLPKRLTELLLLLKHRPTTTPRPLLLPPLRLRQLSLRLRLNSLRLRLILRKSSPKPGLVVRELSGG